MNELLNLWALPSFFGFCGFSRLFSSFAPAFSPYSSVPLPVTSFFICPRLLDLFLSHYLATAWCFYTTPSGTSKKLISVRYTANSLSIYVSKKAGSPCLYSWKGTNEQGKAEVTQREEILDAKEFQEGALRW